MSCRGSFIKDPGKTGRRVLLCDLDQGILPFASLPWHVLTQQGLTAQKRNELQPGLSAPNACHSRVVVERGRPAGLVLRPCSEIFGRYARIPAVTLSALGLYKSLTGCFPFPCNVFKTSPRSKHSPGCSGSSILPTLASAGRWVDYSYPLEEIPSGCPSWSGERPAFFSGGIFAKSSEPRAGGEGARTRREPLVAHLAPERAPRVVPATAAALGWCFLECGALSPRAGAPEPSEVSGTAVHFPSSLLNDCGKTDSPSRKWEDGFSDTACECSAAII